MALSTLSHGIDAATVAMGQAILDNADKKAIGEVKEQFLEFFVANKLLHKQQLHSRFCLTHPKNRGSLLLNPNNAHGNGSRIRRVGANLSELHNAVAVDMSPDPVKCQELL